MLFKGTANLRRRMTGTYSKTHESRVLFTEALNWLKQRWERDKPFLLYLHSDETHGPLLPPPRYRRMFTKLSEREMRSINQDKVAFLSGNVKMSERDFANLKGLACAELRHVDAWIGRCLAYLEDSALLDNTIVIVMADHGDNFGEHGLMRHGLCLYDTLIKIPLIVAHPGQQRPRRIGGLAQAIDLLPTLMSLAGIREAETEREFQGSDLIQAVSTGQFAEYAVSELYRPVYAYESWFKNAPDWEPEFREKFDRVLRSIRTTTHKYLWSSNGRHELYNLIDDPGECRNLIDAEPAPAAGLSEELNTWLESIEGAAQPRENVSEPGHQDDDPEVVQRLMDLGYLE